ncbi:MAG: Flp pilus assembly complex ATPase component TadA [Clostridia bacterium]|nr:Flp pilus assembly complex ATPase component TadA [Clostridia bacterium]
MEIVEYLEEAVQKHASDLFIVAGGTVSIKLEGHLQSIRQERLLPPKTRSLITEIYTLAERSMDHYLENGDDDFAFAIPSLARFRVNAYRQRGSLAAVIRVVSFKIPDWQQIHIPQRIMDLAATTHGMILMTGTAGSGKSTTQACIIDRINQTRDCHIITLEESVRFSYCTDLRKHRKENPFYIYQNTDRVSAPF